MNKKAMKKVVMVDSNKNTTPVSKMPLGTYADGTSFGEPWEYASVVVMLMYLSIKSRSGIQFEVNQFARFTQNKRRSHDGAVNRILCYLVGTQRKGLTLNTNSDMNMDCHLGADFSGL